MKLNLTQNSRSQAMNATNKSKQKPRRLSFLRSFNKELLSILIAASSIMFAPTAIAESVSMQVSEQGDQYQQTPNNGQKMENVEIEFGTPIQKISAVGEPPITKWVYQGFTVYFEHEIVLHTVVHRS